MYSKVPNSALHPTYRWQVFHQNPSTPLQHKEKNDVILLTMKIATQLVPWDNLATVTSAFPRMIADICHVPSRRMIRTHPHTTEEERTICEEGTMWTGNGTETVESGSEMETLESADPDLASEAQSTKGIAAHMRGTGSMIGTEDITRLTIDIEIRMTDAITGHPHPFEQVCQS